MANLVSVIIPLYNCEKYLRSTIFSILNQTYTNLEIIIVEDHSQDNSFELAKKISKNEKKIKLYQNKGKGVSSARNYGIELSNGKYIMFVDADDILNPNCIQHCIELIEYYKADIVKFNYRKKFKMFKINNKFPFPETTLISGKNSFMEKIFPIFLNSYGLNNVWGQLIDKEILKKTTFDTNLIMGEDLKFNIQLYKKCDQILFLNETYLDYRHNVSGTTKSVQPQIVNKRIMDVINAYFELYKVAEEFKINSISIKQQICNRIFTEVINNFIVLLDNKNISKQDLEEIYTHVLEQKKVVSLRNNKLRLIEDKSEFIEKCKQEKNKTKMKKIIKRMILR